MSHRDFHHEHQPEVPAPAGVGTPPFPQAVTPKSQKGRWAVIHTPRAFHTSFPEGARPQLKLFKDLWFWVFMIITVPSFLLCLVMMRLSSPINGLVGEGIVTAVLLALVQIAVVVGLFRLIPIFKGTPKRLIFLALAWGGFSAVALAGGVLSPPWLSVAEKMGWFSHSMSIGAAVPEELVKALGVMLLLWIGRAWWNRPWHGLVAGMLVGLGFDAYENALYSVTMGITHPASDLQGAVEVFSLRLVAGPLLHVMFTGIFGWALGRLMYEGGNFTRAQRWGSILLWGVVAISGHYMWNILPSGEDEFVVNVVSKIIVYIVLVGLLVWLNIAQSRRVLPLQRAGLEPAVTMSQRVK
ncbi:hypothetical protein CUROG_00755 [Corynebacterium urogenitale]|uniref:PrsW family intramembrane metalloprotease n=1 Tax=Corynebacterium urogenitale TaxID=2487892 RepID=A0A5J6Z792_9CORY|nr:PrsW family intramembrane metalloprotease [Corynebacterium urogenitale]QFQ01555.1 hypothetical protein CUROG_00755 [Corynebacterium urogenitale]